MFVRYCAPRVPFFFETLLIAKNVILRHFVKKCLSTIGNELTSHLLCIPSGF